MRGRGRGRSRGRGRVGVRPNLVVLEDIKDPVAREHKELVVTAERHRHHLV